MYKTENPQNYFSLTKILLFYNFNFQVIPTASIIFRICWTKTKLDFESSWSFWTWQKTIRVTNTNSRLSTFWVPEFFSSISTTFRIRTEPKRRRSRPRRRPNTRLTLWRRKVSSSESAVSSEPFLSSSLECSFTKTLRKIMRPFRWRRLNKTGDERNERISKMLRTVLFRSQFA